MLFFFLYGSVRYAASFISPNWVFPDQDRMYLLPIWGALFLCYALYAFTTPRQLSGISTFLNTVAAILALVIAATLAYNAATGGWLGAQPALSTQTEVTRETDEASPKYPDVFYIILDGYARQDILANYFDYNNAWFGTLGAMGFVVAGGSRANYCQTALSLASSLNMDYIDALLPSERPSSRNRFPLVRLIENSAAARAFQP